MQADGSVVQSRWEDANNQKWKVIRDVRGNYYIQNVESSKGISFGNGSIQGTVYNQNALNNCSGEEEMRYLPTSA